jgi:hypothetical protein
MPNLSTITAPNLGKYGVERPFPLSSRREPSTPSGNARDRNVPNLRTITAPNPGNCGVERPFPLSSRREPSTPSGLSVCNQRGSITPPLE